MKKQLLFLLLCASISFNVIAQSVTITSVISNPVAVGTVLKVDYKYTVAADSYIFCGINLQNDWTYISYVAGQGLDLAVAGTDVTGSFNITIPSGTTPTANLTGLQNYKIAIELKSLPSYTWIAGDYPATQLNFTAAAAVTPSITATTIPTSTQVGMNLAVNYKYTVAAAGKVSVAVTKNGGVNAWDYISTVGYVELDPAVAGTNVTGTFTVAIPAETTPTSSLTGNQNYRVTLELKDAGGNWLAGDYSTVGYNFTAAPLGIDKKNLIKGLSVYPNPVSDVLKIANADSLDSASFSIVDILGKTIVKPKTLNNDAIDVSNLSSGFYILSVSSEGEAKQFKFQKK
ncbi:T9SS type A sorting domain-containing protein [Flavobacterium sp.]|uniref:T9SS type A sorting domain-containing protein n=1 Tax=Flavobacterium sp. TaxID=239 RepID=UPI00286D70CB|nr:T9SS type A sorting domain-containing protein [Flavobacterium sp.]